MIQRVRPLRVRRWSNAADPQAAAAGAPNADAATASAPAAGVVAEDVRRNRMPGFPVAVAPPVMVVGRPPRPDESQALPLTGHEASAFNPRCLVGGVRSRNEASPGSGMPAVRSRRQRDAGSDDRPSVAAAEPRHPGGAATGRQPPSWAALLRRSACLLGLVALGCAEIRRPPPAPPPAALAPGAADPLRGAIEAMAPAFADQGRGLADRPAEAAQSAARLEFVAAAVPRDPRYAAVPDSVQRDLILARAELRDALGVAEDARPEVVVRALLAAGAALRLGQGTRAAAALPAPIFLPGGQRSVARLGELGPLPQTAIASANAAQAVARLDATNGWPGGRPGEASAEIATTFGFGANTSVGY